MISKKLQLNNVEYIVRANNKQELDKAVQFLYECNEPEMAQLETPMEVQLEIITEEEPAKPQAPKRSNAPKAPGAPKQAPKKTVKTSNKTVNLGGMGKSE